MGIGFDFSPTGRRKNKDRDFSFFQILLILQVLIGTDKDIKGTFGLADQLPVGDLIPSHFMSSGNLVARELFSKGQRDPVIKQNPHRLYAANRDCSANLRTSPAWFRVTLGNH